MTWINDAYKQLEISGGSAATTDALGSWLFANASQIWCNLPTPKATLEAYTWKEIKQLGDALSASVISRNELVNVYNINIGSTKTAIINNELHTCRIIGILHDQATSTSQNKLGFTFEIVDYMSEAAYMFAVANDNTASWRTSFICDKLNTVTNYPNHTDPELLTVITKAAKKYARSVTDGTTVQYFASVFWLLSEIELTGNTTNTIDNCQEGVQYEYYRNGGSSQKGSVSYWLRSPNRYDSTNSSAYFVGVNNQGVTTPYVVNYEQNFAPCFCIGQATFCLLSSIMENMSEGNHELTFKVNNTNVVSNKLYLHKESSPTPTIDTYFLTADSGNPNFNVLRTAGGSTYDDLVVQDSPTPPILTTTVSFVPSSGGGGIMYTINGGSEITTVSTNQSTSIVANTINFMVGAQSATKITVTNNQGVVIYEGQNYTYTASSSVPSITVTQSALGTWDFQVTDSSSVTHNYTCTEGSTWAQFIATDPVGQALFGVESGTNYVWYDNSSGYLYYDSAKTVHVSSEQTIMLNREYYSGGTAPAPGITVSGTWRFNDTVNPPSTELSQENLSFVSGGSSFTSIFARINNDVITYDSQGVYSFSFDEWPNVLYKEISFNGSNTMSQDFYTWFSANATQIN